jgi:hypothetical protein
MHTSESEYQSTFTLREKMWCFVHAALKSCQERKKASLSLYLDIKALAHGDFSGLFFLYFFLFKFVINMACIQGIMCICPYYFILSKKFKKTK